MRSKKENEQRIAHEKKEKERIEDNVRNFNRWYFFLSFDLENKNATNWVSENGEGTKGEEFHLWLWWQSYFSAWT